VREESIDLARLLVKRGAETTAKDHYGWTPLHLAVWVGSMVLARLLVDHGADVTAQGNDGRTPLNLAVYEGREDLTRLLVEHRTDATAQDNHGSTPSHVEQDTQYRHGRTHRVKHLFLKAWQSITSSSSMTQT
jgi:ankyrin repeat protein